MAVNDLNMFKQVQICLLCFKNLEAKLNAVPADNLKDMCSWDVFLGNIRSLD